MKSFLFFLLSICTVSTVLAQLKINIGDTSFHKFVNNEGGVVTTGTVRYTVKAITNETVVVEDKWVDDGSDKYTVGEISYSLRGLERWFGEILVRCLAQGGTIKTVKIGNESIEACERLDKNSIRTALQIVAPTSPQETVYSNVKQTAEQSSSGVATEFTLEMLSYAKGSKN